jgi:hypothetical protein
VLGDSASQALSGSAAMPMRDGRMGGDEEWAPGGRRAAAIAYLGAELIRDLGLHKANGWGVGRAQCCWAGLKYCAHTWAARGCRRIRVIREFRLPGIETRLTRNNFGFLEMTPDITFGFSGLGFFGFGVGFFGFGVRVSGFLPTPNPRGRP